MSVTTTTGAVAEPVWQGCVAGQDVIVRVVVVYTVDVVQPPAAVVVEFVGESVAKPVELV